MMDENENDPVYQYGDPRPLPWFPVLLIAIVVVAIALLGVVNWLS
jgi:hypothetical protein